MAIEYQRHWRCRDCAREGRRDPCDREHVEGLNPVCCFCSTGTMDLGWVAIPVVPAPRPLPLFPDEKPPPGPPAFRILRGGKERP